MTKSERERLARTYRLLAGRLHLHLANGKAEASGAREEIRAAHDALCRAFTKMER